jgi:periplasmic protein TonB
MFESSLIDLEPKKKSRRALILPVALAIHCVALASVTFASYWNVSAIAEPPLNAVLFVSLVPPPPPLIRRGTNAPKPKPQAAVQEQKPEVKVSGPVQPDLEKIPEKAQENVAANDTTSDLVGPGDPDGDRDGPEDGVIWGVKKGVGPVDSFDHGPVDGPHGPGVVTDQPIHFTVGMTRPALTYQVQPRYSEAARRAGVQGAVIVEAVIDEQGRVTDVKILRGLPMGLDREAVAAVRQWRFTPATLQGKPVKVYFSLTVNFRIQR